MLGMGTKSVVGLLVLILAITYNFYFTRKVYSPTIKIESGELTGIVSESRNGRNYFSYFAIPYAQPPVGELRFEVSFF
jgi:hypothetical protein